MNSGEVHVDLKPGSKVYVDPIFFTDGSEVKNFHDHCKPEKRTLKPEQIVGDLKFIEDYCAKKTFTFDPKGYHTLNNHGERVMLDKIEFHISEARGVKDESVPMGYSSVRSFSLGSVTPPRLLRPDNAPQYFFVMAQDKATLEWLVPVTAATNAETSLLLDRARQLALQVKGLSASGGTRDVAKAKDVRSPLRLIREPSIYNPLVADIDGDGQLDMAVSSHAIYESRDGRTQDWIGYLYVLGNERNFVGAGAGTLGWRDSRRLGREIAIYENFLLNGYPVNAPLVAIRLQDCGYLLTYVYDVAREVATGVALENPEATEETRRPKCIRWVAPKLYPAP